MLIQYCTMSVKKMLRLHIRNLGQICQIALMRTRAPQRAASSNQGHPRVPRCAPVRFAEFAISKVPCLNSARVASRRGCPPYMTCCVRASAQCRGTFTGVYAIPSAIPM